MDGFQKILGFDLGTTNSVVAVLEGEEPRVIPNLEGGNKTASVVAFLDNGKIVVGDAAKRQAATNPDRTVFSVKRLMGRHFSDLVESGEASRLKLIADEEDRALISIGDVGYSPQQISALILREMKRAADEHLGEETRHAIITVPAYFDDLQRTATLEAARIAGLEVLRLVNEPTAAAMAYGLGREAEELVAVYDLGGGTFDISILEIDHNTFEVLNCDGDTRLGGDDFDLALVELLRQRFEEQHSLVLEPSPLVHRRLLEAAEEAKIQLSAAHSAHVRIPFLVQVDEKPLHLETVVTREQFEELLRPFVDRTIDICEKALKDARVAVADVRKAILVGGSTRIPLVQQAVEDFFGIAPYKGVNPDEIVALGAATQAGVLRGELADVVLLDVVSHSLGVEVKGGRVSSIIEKNSTIPIKAAKTFTTTEDNQPFVNIHVLQGENESASENRSLGKFTLSDIAPGSAGAPRIRVTFFINPDGVVEVSAVDLQSGQEKSLTITHSFLDTEERKRRDHDRRRRKRHVRREPVSDLRLEGVPLTPGDTGRRPSARTDAEETSRAELALQDFAEVSAGDEEDTPAGGQSPARRAVVSLAGANERLPGDTPAPGKKKPASTSAKKKSPPPATPPETVGPEEMADAAELEDLHKALEWLAAGRKDDAARTVYQAAEPIMKRRLNRNPADTDVRKNYARLALALDQAQKCREILYGFDLEDPDTAAEVFQEYGALVERYPNYIQARIERARLALRLNMPRCAMEDLEKAFTQDETRQDVAEVLADAYRRALETQDDPEIRFKLVRAALRLNRLDEAIGILQELASNSAHRTRANRILGLCYWQLDRLDEAWNALRNLEADDDLKDSLYRLAGDMEARDQLMQAREIFLKLTNADGDFRDATARLKKLDFRVRLRAAETAREKSDDKVLIGGSRFQILEEINRGSMGIIYKAQDRVLDETIALKVLNDSLTADRTAVERFKQEARAAKRLAHRNIVRIHDMFELADSIYGLSMEFIEGRDLKTMLAGGETFEEGVAMEYVRQALEALDYAHSLRVVHRDIKPANIMITRSNEVKITDFGIAKIQTAKDRTQTGTSVLGTPLYMSPEQIEGRDVTARVDLYSLGVMTYEMLCGTPPFYKGNIEYQHMHSAPPALPESVSPRIRDFILRCLEKKAEDRFQSSRDALLYLSGA